MILDTIARDLQRGDVVDRGFARQSVADVVRGREAVMAYFANGDRQSFGLDDLVRVLNRDDTSKAAADARALDHIAAIIREPVLPGSGGKLRRIRQMIDTVRPLRPKLDPDKVLVDIDADGRIVAVDVAGKPISEGAVSQLPLSTVRAIRGEGRYLTWRLPEMPPSELTLQLDTWERP